MSWTDAGGPFLPLDARHDGEFPYIDAVILLVCDSLFAFCNPPEMPHP